jgi:hypothetical protein
VSGVEEEKVNVCVGKEVRFDGNRNLRASQS